MEQISHKYNTCKRQEKTIFWISLMFIFAPERRIPKIQKRVGNVKKNNYLWKNKK